MKEFRLEHNATNLTNDKNDQQSKDTIMTELGHTLYFNTY